MYSLHGNYRLLVSAMISERERERERELPEMTFHFMLLGLTYRYSNDMMDLNLMLALVGWCFS